MRNKLYTKDAIDRIYIISIFFRNDEIAVAVAPGPPRPRTAIRPPSARPASARPAAPRIRDRGQVPLQEEIVK